MTDATDSTDPESDTASGGAPDQPDHHNLQGGDAESDMKDDGSTEHVTVGDDDAPVDNPAG